MGKWVQMCPPRPTGQMTKTNPVYRCGIFSSILSTRPMDMKECTCKSNSHKFGWSHMSEPALFLFLCGITLTMHHLFLMRDIYARFMVCYFQNKRPSLVFGSLFSLLFGLPVICMVFLRGTSVPSSDRELFPPRCSIYVEVVEKFLLGLHKLT